MPELRLGEHVLDGLGHHVRGRVAQDAKPVGVGDHDGLDHREGPGRLVEVDELAVDAGDRDATQPGDQLAEDVGPRRRVVDRPDVGLPGDDDCDLRGHGTPRVRSRPGPGV